MTVCRTELSQLPGQGQPLLLSRFPSEHVHPMVELYNQGFRGEGGFGQFHPPSCEPAKHLGEGFEQRAEVSSPFRQNVAYPH